MKRFFRKYYVIELTPLKFHRFYYLVLTPVNIFLAIYATIDMFLHPETLDAISVIYNLAILACCVLTFIGCFKLRKYAWFAIMGGFGLELVYDLCALLLVAPFGMTAMWNVFSQVLWRIVLIILMIIYYVKRQPLFFDPVPLSELPKELREEAQKKKRSRRQQED